MLYRWRLRRLHNNTDKHDRPIKSSSFFVKEKKSTYGFAALYCEPNTEPPTIHAVEQLDE